MNVPGLDGALAYLRANQQLSRLAGVAALVVAMSAWTSCSAWKTTKVAREKTEEAVAIRATAERFAQQFMPASTAESEEWSRSTAEAAEFGSPEAAKLSLAQTVSRIAEVAGMSGVRASFAGLDSAGAAQSRNLGDLTFESATFGLRLEGSGSVPAVSRVILRLPPSTEINSISLSGNTDELKATFHLAVYQPAGGTQN